MHRAVLTSVLSFFLLFMQQEDIRHALDHLGAQLQRSEHSALERPASGACVECELLAAGTASVPATLPAALATAPAWLTVAAPVARSAAATPSYYRSRAPPRILQHA